MCSRVTQINMFNDIRETTVVRAREPRSYSGSDQRHTFVEARRGLPRNVRYHADLLAATASGQSLHAHPPSTAPGTRRYVGGQINYRLYGRGGISKRSMEGTHLRQIIIIGIRVELHQNLL